MCNRMNVEGTAQLLASCQGGASVVVDAIISKDLDNEILLSWFDMQALGVLPVDFPNKVAAFKDKHVIPVDSLEEIKVEFADVLQDMLGKCMKGPPMHMHLRKDKPMPPRKIYTARRIPLHNMEKAKKTLDKDLRTGVLVPVDVGEVTDVISLGHFVDKGEGSDELRLVSDFIYINEYVERPIHPFPSTANIIREIQADSRYFAKLDAVQGYHQIP